MTSEPNINQAETAGVKSKALAVGLALFFVGPWVCNFYLGYIKKAVIQISLCAAGVLLLTLGIVYSGILYPEDHALTGVSLYLGVAMLAVGTIWGIVQISMLLAGSIKADGKGRPFSADTNYPHRKKGIVSIALGVCSMLSLLAMTPLIAFVWGDEWMVLVMTLPASVPASAGLTLSVYANVKGGRKFLSITGIVLNGLVICALLVCYFWSAFG